MPDVKVRFSVENAEVVRTALQNLGKDGEKALRTLDAASSPVNKNLGALSGLANDLKSRWQGFATALGPVGAALTAIGPAGLVAAGALGALFYAFSSVKEGAKEFG